MMTSEQHSFTYSKLSCRYLPMVGVLSVIVLLMTGCNGLTGKEQSDRMLINHLLDDLEQAVAMYEGDKIQDFLHTDFHHNGRTKTEQIYIWEERLLLYYSLSLADRNIVVRGDYATAYFLMTFRGHNNSIVSDEPSDEYGDISYLIKEDGKWYLYGNQ